MTYYKDNPYKEPVTAWAHDECLPHDEAYEMVRGVEMRRDRWGWSPTYGAEHECHYCGKPTQ